MDILSFGNSNNPIMVLVHGFESPYQIWEKYIQYYKNKFYIIVPILPGHNPDKKEEFTTFNKAVSDFLDIFTEKFGTKIFALYAMSMGGVFAAKLWLSQKVTIEKLLFESSPLRYFNPRLTRMLNSQYLKINEKARNRNKRVLKNAIKNMITEDKLEIFLRLIDNISDTTVSNYLTEITKFNLPYQEEYNNSQLSKTKIYYCYGGKFSEFIFKKISKFISKNYSNSETKCIKGKGHCETSLLHPDIWITELNKIL